VDQRVQVKTLTGKDIIAVSGITYLDELWVRKSAFSKLEPKVDLVTQIANHFKVDAVLMCTVSVQKIDPPTGSVSMYLIKAPSGEKFYAGGSTMDFDEKGMELSKRLGQELFDKIGTAR
jgi:hypothetical protein